MEEKIGQVEVGNNTSKKNFLSKEFRVAVEIYTCHVNGERVWFTKLVERLKSEMSKEDVMRSLNLLFDWGIVKGEYGENSGG